MAQPPTARRLAPIVLALTLGTFPAAVAHAEDWSWSLTPYLWASSVALDLEVGGEPVLGGDAAFGDLLKKTDLAFMAHFEGRRGRHGFFADLIYFDLSDSKGVSVGPPSLGLEATSASDLGMSIVELGGLWNPSGDGLGFGLLYGLRLVDVDAESRFRLALPGQPSTRVRIADTLVDGMLGVRYRGELSSRWSYGLRADLSAGGTDGAWNALLLVSYELGSSGKYRLDLAYRYLEMEVEGDGGGFDRELEIALSGPIVGVEIGW